MLDSPTKLRSYIIGRLGTKLLGELHAIEQPELIEDCSNLRPQPKLPRRLQRVLQKGNRCGSRS